MQPSPTADGLLPSPPGFTLSSPRRRGATDACACGAPASVTAFAGPGACVHCAERRGLAANLLGAIIRGATPEEVLAGPTLSPVDPGWDVLERHELRDHIDVLMAVMA